MEPSVVAILLRYWTERDENLREIVHTLQKGTCAPDKIIVFDQSGAPAEHRPRLPRGVHVIRSLVNFGSRARYALAMLERSVDYFLFHDDDVLLPHDGLERLMQHARPYRVVGVRGFVGSPDTNGVSISGNEITKPVSVDWLVGWVHLVHVTALVRYFEATMRLGALPNEDTLMGRVNECVIAPVPIRHLPSGDVGLDSRPIAHEHSRDLTVNTILEAGL